MRTALALGLVACLTTVAQAQAPNDMQLHPSAQMRWRDGPATLPKGAQMTVLEGDPTKPGMFTMRIKFPAGMHVAPHWHTQTEHATVIAGALHIGMGDRFDSAATRRLAAGSFGYW